MTERVTHFVGDDCPGGHRDSWPWVCTEHAVLECPDCEDVDSRADRRQP